MLTVSLFGAGADQPDAAGSDESTMTGFHTDSDASLDYQWRGRRAAVSVNGRSVFRYDAARAAVLPMGQAAALQWTLTGPRRQFHASQSLNYSPFYQFGGVSDLASALDATAQSHGDFANSSQSAHVSASGLEWTEVIGRGSALSFSYDRRQATFSRRDLDMQSQSAGVHFGRQLSRHLSLRAGYGYRFADYALQNRPARNQDLDFGIGYSGPLAFSRRTTITFSSGSSAATEQKGTTLVLTGTAAVTHQIGRTWSAQVGLDRGVHLLEGFVDPVVSNTIRGGVTGAFGRRVQFSSSGTFSTGAVGAIASGDAHYAMSTAVVGLHVTLSRRAAFDAQYFYSGQRFDQNVQLAPEVPNRLERHGVRVGLTWRGPIAGHVRGGA